ncbi:outer membrane receptor protein involved in Fe transport [Flagellimonas meridianipacifica]|uniref:Outer membrane receptor protein involved in Fe transport n=2 Tax=Flagellimonas meridianipacifica TaxID=1080225 RepID=A0A2T0MAF6_9FLAO|nr:TonB-dependent receptor [Allomuricauda pacifica]PRX54473.1 outer membrane receptor protein involved in Fe transport [Allomuricauda pacifica]
MNLGKRLSISFFMNHVHLSRKCLSLLFFITFTIVSAQEKFTLSGTISEASSNETLIGVTIVFPELRTGVTTNEYGFYSITLPQGEYEVIVSYLGFQDVRESVNLTEDIKKDFRLVEEMSELDEVVVTDDVERLDIKKPQISVNSLSSQTIKQIPVVLGEADVIKSLILLPGVTNAGEASSGFNVRGGAADQNLILLDEAIVFNSSHLFGFFSVFNPDAIKDVKLFKGGIPARYGGRVSSVLDIFQKEGNSKELKVSGGIGAVASRLLVEGPIDKDRTAFLIGGRASYAHLFLPLFDIDNRAYFYDLNTKINHRINERNSIFLSGYFGRDLFSINDSFVNVYGNAVGNFRWNHLFSDKLFSNLSVIYSDYFYGLELDFVGFEWDSGIQNFNLKYDLKHYLNDKITLDYGLNNIYYVFNPGKIKPNREDSGIVEDQLTKKYANETAAYVSVEHKVSEQLSLNYGLRVSHFNRLGQDELFVYENDNPVIFDPFLLVYREAVPIDTINPGRGGSLDNFTNLEPRVSLAYNFQGKSSIKASYTRLAQYLHLLSNTNSPTPLDVWTPSGPFVEPQLLDQYAVGYFRDINEGEFSLEVEAFYKDIQNRIDYIDGADLIANDAIEQVILNGEARAYGLELLLRKNEGVFKGWLAYTLSRSEQRTPGRTLPFDNGRSNLETGINFGEWYSTPFDKTHDISVFASYDASEKWNFNANFIYQTGQPTNFPEGQFEFQGLTVPFFGLRNQERLPDFHRLDISATLTPKRNKRKKVQSEWVFSIYNVYNRMNAASINFRENEDTGRNEALRTSIFGIIPSVTYNFKF